MPKLKFPKLKLSKNCPENCPGKIIPKVVYKIVQIFVYGDCPKIDQAIVQKIANLVNLMTLKCN